MEPARRERAAHLRPTVWAVVWLGGASGTTARFLITRATPHLHGVPVSTLGINVVGAFLLGLLLAGLAGAEEDGPRRLLRLGLGTGLLGGFTTYSALAVETTTLLAAGRVGIAAAYAFATVLLGALASYGGLRVGGRAAGRGRS